MDEIIGASIGGLLVALGLAFAVWRFFHPRPRPVYVPVHRLIQYGARYKGERDARIVYPSAAAAANDPRWANPGGWHTVGRLVEVASDGKTLLPRSEWSRTYANDIKAIRRDND